MAKTVTKEIEEVVLTDDELNSVVGGVNVPKVKYVCTTCGKTYFGALERKLHTQNTGHKYFSSEHKSC